MERSIRDYVSEGADVSYEVLVSRFGEPEQVAFTYANEMTTEEVLEHIRNGKKFVKIAFVTAVALIVVWIGYAVLCFINIKRDANGYLAVGEVVIIDKTEISDGG